MPSAYLTASKHVHELSFLVAVFFFTRFIDHSLGITVLSEFLRRAVDHINSVLVRLSTPENPPPELHPEECILRVWYLSFLT